MRGRLPEGWTWVALEEVADVRTGIAKNSGVVRDPVRLPYLRVANVQDGYLDLSEIKEIEVERSDVARFSLSAGDVLLTEGGDFDKLGRGCVWRAEINPCLHQNHVFAVRPKTSRLLPEFLSAVCGSSYGKRYFLSCSKQTTNLASINSSQLKIMPVPLPSVDEQRRIIAALDACDRAITTAGALIAAKRRRGNALLERLCGFAFDRASPKGWRLVALGKIFSERDERSAELPLLAITGERGVVPRDEVDRRDTSAEDKRAYKVIRPGDIGYNTMRMWQGVFGLSRLEGIISPAYTVVTPRLAEIRADFAVHLFRHPRAVHTFGRYSQGLVDDTLALKFHHFSEIKFRIPGLHEQERIARILDKHADEMFNLKAHLQRLWMQKRGLMQKLLTGEWRLDDTEVVTLPRTLEG